jgi:hypothetical protein
MSGNVTTTRRLRLGAPFGVASGSRNTLVAALASLSWGAHDVGRLIGTDAQARTRRCRCESRTWCFRSFGSMELGGRGAGCALPQCGTTSTAATNNQHALVAIPFTRAPGHSRGGAIGLRFTEKISAFERHGLQLVQVEGFFQDTAE